MMIPTINSTDFKTLKTLIANYPVQLKTKEVGNLAIELGRANIVEDEAINPNIIRLGSKFDAQDLDSLKIWTLTLTLPEEADMTKQRISVFSPLGVALIGFSKGDTVEWSLPGGLKKLKILAVKN
ncbi:MAG: GreA/GreB family elongation factor [Saprospiraceae bacterium]|nr:GreA/GreB family elongation factor [Candidatus Parvibacillus calidus]